MRSQASIQKGFLLIISACLLCECKPVVDLNRALKNRPETSAQYYDRAYAKMELEKDFHGALNDLNEAININSKFIKAYSLRGLVKSNLKDTHGAIEDYTKELELAPRNSYAYYNRANERVVLNDLTGAIADYSKSVALNPKYVNAYVNSGITRYKLEDDVGAIEDSKAIRLDPKQAQAYFNRGMCKFNLDQDGCVDLNKAKELGHDRAKKAIEENCGN